MNRTKVSVFVEKDAIEVGGLVFVAGSASSDYVLGGLTLRHLVRDDKWILYSNLKDITETTPEECLAKAREISNQVYLTLYLFSDVSETIPEPTPVEEPELPF